MDETRWGVNISEKLPHDPLCEGGACGCGKRAFPDEALECINGPEGCRGSIEYRMPLSGTGQSFPRCDWHWEQRLELEEGLNQRYPMNPPADWSPLDAGEAWGEDDY